MNISPAAQIAIIVPTDVAVIIVAILVLVPIGIWIFRALTGKLGR
jgi:hypothetical protein